MTRTLERFPDNCLLYQISQGWVATTPWGLRSRPRSSRDAALRWLNTERYLREKRDARNVSESC